MTGPVIRGVRAARPYLKNKKAPRRLRAPGLS